MASNEFERYLKDFQDVCSEAKEGILNYKSSKNDEESQEYYRSVQTLMDDADRYIRILEDEMNQTIVNHIKHEREKVIIKCHTQQKQLELEFKNATKKDSPSRRNQTSPKEDTMRYVERAERLGQILDEAQRQIAEGEAIAADANSRLRDQRAVLEATHGNVHETRQDTKEARGHLLRLTIKALTNQVLLILIIILLLAAIFLFSYYKWYPRDQTDFLGILPKKRTETVSSTLEL